MKHKLASIQVINDIKPHPNADLLELAYVNGWQVVIPKGAYEVGEDVIFFEIDSFIPEFKELSFLAKSSLRHIGEVSGYWIRSMKLRGELSQGLIVKYHQVKLSKHHLINIGLDIGSDVSDLLDVVSYQSLVEDDHVNGLRPVPHFIPKKEEEDQVQNLTYKLEELQQDRYYVTEKLHGCRASLWYDYNQDSVHYGFKNFEITKRDHPFYRLIVKENFDKLLAKLKYNIAIIGEFIGPNICGNPYNLEKHKFKVFSIYDYKCGHRWSYKEMSEFCYEYGLELVPLVYFNVSLPKTIWDLIECINSYTASRINPSVKREGLIYRSLSKQFGFKVISNNRLLGE